MDRGVQVARQDDQGAVHLCVRERVVGDLVEVFCVGDGFIEGDVLVFRGEFRAGVIGGEEFVGVQHLGGDVQVQVDDAAAEHGVAQAVHGALGADVGLAGRQRDVVQLDFVQGEGALDVGEGVAQGEVRGDEEAVSDFEAAAGVPFAQVFRGGLIQSDVDVLVPESVVRAGAAPRLALGPFPVAFQGTASRPVGVARTRFGALTYQGIQPLAGAAAFRPCAGFAFQGRRGKGRVVDADAVDALSEMQFFVPAGEGDQWNGAGFDGAVAVFEGVAGILGRDIEGVFSGHRYTLGGQGADDRMDLPAEFRAFGGGCVLGGQADGRAADEGGPAVGSIEAVHVAAYAEDVGAEGHIVAFALGQADVGAAEIGVQGIRSIVETDAGAGQVAVQVCA